MQLKDASVLVVDDEEILRDYLGRWFEREGAKVYRAGNGTEALGMLEGQHVDLIVSDIRMPVLDGVGMLKALRATGRSRPSVIFVTGFSDYTERELFDLGAEALLAKPFNRNEMIEAAASSLAERGEMWRTPVPEETGQKTVAEGFASLSGAIAGGQIAFGRGGFMLRTGEVLTRGAVGLELRFREEKYVLAGSGTVRWMETRAMQTGIEFRYVAEESRAKVVALTTGCQQYIPGWGGD